MGETVKDKLDSKNVANKKGVLVVITGPSGVGKSTAVKQLQKEINLGLPVSYTTRKPREGEQDGVDYHFVSKDKFQQLKNENEFLESAQFNGNWYGTSKTEVFKLMNEGQNVLLDLEVQGALNVKNIMPEAITVFIEAPSQEELERRLRGRGTDSEQDIQNRLKQGLIDSQKANQYDKRIVCNTTKQTVLDLKNIINNGKMRVHSKEVAVL